MKHALELVMDMATMLVALFKKKLDDWRQQSSSDGELVFLRERASELTLENAALADKVAELESELDGIHLSRSATSAGVDSKRDAKILHWEEEFFARSSDDCGDDVDIGQCKHVDAYGSTFFDGNCMICNKPDRRFKDSAVSDDIPF